MMILGGVVIRRFDRQIAERVLASWSLAVGNRRLADYWLSLWEGDELPQRRRFAPAAVRDLLAGIMIQEVKPGVRMTVRLCGTAINQAFGRDLTGCDLIALSPPAVRAERLARNSRIAEGAIGLATRRGETRMGRPVASQEIHLPFADITEDGARLILLHSSWRPKSAEPGVAEVEDVLRLAEEFQIVPLWSDAPVAD